MRAGGAAHSSYEYDDNNRVKKVNSISYSYDKNGNLEKITTAAGTTEYEYNKNNAVKKVTNTLSDETVISMYSYTYYANGNQKTKTDKNGVVTTYVYDGAGRLTAVSTPDLVREYAYDNAGNRESMSEIYPKLSEGATRTEAFGDETVEYDSKTVHYLYSKANVLTTATEVYTNGEAATGKSITRHTFDKAGNEISTSVEYVLPYAELPEEPSEEPSEAATGEIVLTSAAGNDYYGSRDYDLAIEVTINEYNALNQLVGMSRIKNGKRSSAEYIYNGDGLRVAKSVNADETGYYEYVYSGKTLVGMTNGEGAGIDAMYIGAFGCQQIDYISGGTEYNFTNAHGDVTNTVGADGTILNTFDYDEFGNLTVCEENGASYLEMAHFRYAGEYYDIETGNYYLKARYYNPATGRFTQIDGFIGYDDNVLSLNRYTYCHNNPIMFVDPSGHYEIEAAGYKLTVDDDLYWDNFAAINAAVMHVSTGEITAEEFFSELQGYGTPAEINGIDKELIYNMSISPDRYEVSMAEKYLLNFRAEYQNEFIEYYVDISGGFKIGKNDIYTVLYDAPALGDGTGRYADYQFSVFDALGWMIATSGNVNYVLQIRFYDNLQKYGLMEDGSIMSTEFIEANPGVIFGFLTKQLSSYDKTLNAFSNAYSLLDGYVKSEQIENTISKPQFFLGTPENTLSLLQDIENPNTGISKSAIGHFIDMVYTPINNTYSDYIGGFYFGDEDPTRLRGNKNFLTAMQELSDFAHPSDINKKIVWIPWIGNEADFNAIRDDVVCAEQKNSYPLVDIVILQPGRFYGEVGKPDPRVTAQIENSLFVSVAYNSMTWVSEDIGEPSSYSENIIPDNVSVGVEFEFDYSRYTGRANNDMTSVVAYPNEKNDRLSIYFKKYGQFIGKETIGIYSGGPNEQGMRNIHTNNNYHSNRNYLAIDSDGNVINIAVDIKGNPSGKVKTYSQFSKEIDGFEGNFTYDVYSEHFIEKINK